MAELKAAGAICYLQEGKETLFLILRSSKHGNWGPPKGHAEPGETEMETAVREIYEEVGMRRVRFAPRFRETISYNVQKKDKLISKEVVYFLCEMDSDNINISEEHSEAHLATLDEIEVLIEHEEIRAIFRKALEYVRAASKARVSPTP